MNSFYIVTSNDDIQHHGIKGQKWGIRRYQNYDGTYTSLGKRRRNYMGTGKSKKELRNELYDKIDTSMRIMQNQEKSGYNDALTNFEKYYRSKYANPTSKNAEMYYPIFVEAVKKAADGDRKL